MTCLSGLSRWRIADRWTQLLPLSYHFAMMLPSEISCSFWKKWRSCSKYSSPSLTPASSSQPSCPPVPSASPANSLGSYHPKRFSISIRSTPWWCSWFCRNRLHFCFKLCCTPISFTYMDFIWRISESRPKSVHVGETFSLTCDADEAFETCRCQTWNHNFFTSSLTSLHFYSWRFEFRTSFPWLKGRWIL